MGVRLWFKIPTKILDDPAWGMLADDVWRKRFIETFLDPKKARRESDRSEYWSLRPILKEIVFSRDPNRCAHCGSTKDLEIDHIVPLVRGGTNDPKNLQILCRTCNRKKGAK